MSETITQEDMVLWLAHPALITQLKRPKPMWNDDVTNIPLAVAETHTEFANTWKNPLGYDDGASMAVVMLRDALTPFMIMSRNGLGTGSNSYEWKDSNGNNQFLVAANSSLEILIRGADKFAPTNDLTYHGPTLYPKNDTQQKLYLWQDSDGSPTSFFAISANSATINAAAGNVAVIRSDGTASEQPVNYPFSAFVPVTVSSSLLVAYLGRNGFYRIVVTNNSNTDFSFNIVQTCFGNFFWRQIAVTSYSGAIQNFLSIGLDAVSIEWRNSGAPLYVNGEVVGAEYDMGYDLQRTLLQASVDPYALFASITKQSGNESLTFKDGAWSFLRANDEQNFELKYPLNYLDDAGLAYNGSTPIRQTAPWKVLFAKVQPGASSATTQMVVDTGFRWGTNIQAYDKRLPNARTEARAIWTGALRRTANAAVFYPAADTLRRAIDQQGRLPF